MNRSILAAGALLAFASISMPRAARAQSTGLVPIRLKVGALLPTQSAAKSFSGSVVPAAEVDVRIPSFLGGSYATIGYQERGRNGGKLRTIPITISRTFSPPNPAGAVTGNVYFGLGAGAYLLDVHTSAVNSQSRATVGGFAQIGYQTPSKIFVEAKYQITAQKAAGLSPNGVLLFVGTTF